MPMYFRLQLKFSKQFRWLLYSPYRVVFRIQDSSGWLNGHPMGGLMMFVLLYVRVVFQKGFFLFTWRRYHLYLISILVSWPRNE